MRTEPLSHSDAQTLFDKIDNEKKDLPKLFFFALSFFLLLIFLPGRRGKTSFSSQYGFLKPVFVAVLVAGGFSYFQNKKTLKDLRDDVASNEKIIDAKTVWKKDKSFIDNELCIWIDSDIKGFQKFIISKTEYDSIEKGHTVFLEYSKQSHVLFKLDLKLNIV